MMSLTFRLGTGLLLGTALVLLLSGIEANGQALSPSPSLHSPAAASSSPHAPDTLRGARSVDFRYAPPRWKTLIGFPNGRRKSLVDETGTLTYDYGPGPYARPNTTIRVGVRGSALQRTDQRLLDPKVPVVVTEWKGEAVRMEQNAFALVLDSTTIPAPPPDTFRVDRRNGRTRALGWAQPKGSPAPAFRSVAWGSNRPVRYRIEVEPQSSARVALGFCESYRKAGGIRRLMKLQVEGAEAKTINPAEEAGQNVPHVVFFDAEDQNGDGMLDVEVGASRTTEDPNVFVNALWMFDADAEVTAQQVIRGDATARAEVFVNSGRERERRQLPPRVDAIHATLQGEGITPVVQIRTGRSLSYAASTGVLRENGRPFLVTKPRPTDARRTDEGWVLELPRDATSARVLTLRGHRLPSNITRVPDLTEEQEEAVAHWTALDLPWDRIHLPVPELQALFEASVRTVYQLREPVNGIPQFQPGATVYRGLWAAHLPRAGRALTTLGDTAAARRSLEQVLRHQQRDGQIVVLTPPTLLKETGTSLKALYHQARLSGGKEWLADQWPHVEKAVAWIQAAREQAPDAPSAPNYGLMPAALSDGGVGGIVPEYTTVHWSLLGLRSAMEAARWLGKTKQALEWQAAYSDFWAAYRRGIARDARQDPHGNWFLPIRMNYDPEQHVPQRSQINVCHMIHPGHLYEKDDLLVDGTLGMLTDAESAQGLPVSVGWLDGGVWAEVGFTCAQAHLWNGDVSRAQDLLYTAANHASPTRGWAEEQMPGDSTTRTGGDVPHGNASAEFINLVRALLVLEDKNELSLLKGLPASWIEPGMSLQLNRIHTTFGPVSLSLRVAENGQKGTLTVTPPEASPDRGAPTAYLQALQKAGYVRPDGSSLPDRWMGTWDEEMQLPFKKAPEE